MKKKAAVQAILGADFPAPTPMPSEPDAMKFLFDQLAAVQQQQRDLVANELIGELGMKAAGAPKKISNFDGSPLFGSSQEDLAFTPCKKIRRCELCGRAWTRCKGHGRGCFPC